MDSPRDESAKAVGIGVLCGDVYCVAAVTYIAKNVVFRCGFDGRNGTELRAGIREYPYASFAAAAIAVY
jgi:hypothetical protein